MTDIETFRAVVPILSKRDVFTSRALADLVVDGSLHAVETFITSSGSTGSSFSLGLNDRSGTQSMVQSFDRLMDLWFQTRRRKTFMITTCAMGLTFPTSLPCSNVSVRSDRALALLRALKPYYQQFLMGSDVYFLKKLIEDGLESGLRWRDWPVQFGIGGEWFPETYRRYLASLLAVDLEHPRPPIYILSSMGAAELGFNLCFETHETVRLRQLAAADRRVREALFGAEAVVPLLGHYDPRRWFVELTPSEDIDEGGGAFTFTNADPEAVMPLVRYRTGDCGYILTRGRLREVLSSLNYEAYLPRVTYPLLAVVGRIGQSLRVAGRPVRMELLRQILYSNGDLASVTTGQFRAREQRGRAHIDIQLQASIESRRTAALQKQFSQLFNEHVPAVVRAIPCFEFRDVLAVDYERKFLHNAGQV